MSRNRPRTKDPRGGYRVGKSYKQDTNRTIRHETIPEPEELPRVSSRRGKNTKRWCRGRVGREHQLVVRVDYKWHMQRWIRVCSACDKELDYWYSTKWFATPKPDWLLEDEERRRGE